MKSLTGCPLTPPRLLTSAAQARAPCSMGFRMSPITPLWTPTTPSRISGRAPLGAGVGDPGVPGVGAGAAAAPAFEPGAPPELDFVPEAPARGPALAALPVPGFDAAAGADAPAGLLAPGAAAAEVPPAVLPAAGASLDTAAGDSDTAPGAAAGSDPVRGAGEAA